MIYIKYLDWVWLTISCHWVTKSTSILYIGFWWIRLKVNVSFQPAALFVLLTDNLLIFALLVEADLAECYEYFSVSISAFPSMILHHLLIVLVMTALCGFLQLMISWSVIRKSVVISHRRLTEAVVRRCFCKATLLKLHFGMGVLL